MSSRNRTFLLAFIFSGIRGAPHSICPRHGLYEQMKEIEYGGPGNAAECA